MVTDEERGPLRVQDSHGLSTVLSAFIIERRLTSAETTTYSLWCGGGGVEGSVDARASATGASSEDATKRLSLLGDTEKSWRELETDCGAEETSSTDEGKLGGTWCLIRTRRDQTQAPECRRVDVANPCARCDTHPRPRFLRRRLMEPRARTSVSSSLFSVFPEISSTPPDEPVGCWSQTPTFFHF